ncbi:hypothetical protein VHEMI10032 [[Torrubiella] hemipterigena]|uniref:BZIP domain-containing protein n=1 Tax=[Torrubiella] hemipterigena TaxID=1531966 RepID=A0A0A1TRE6_9HYPO|nr:hypothetical protein VHEMI10032 [[Torrubiella] hemipterigena]
MGSSSKSSGSGTTRRSPGSGRRSKEIKEIDWSNVTDPDERRKLQNCLAQRKFRQKVKDSKEREEREARNVANAGNSYRIPTSEGITDSPVLSGLPWGGVDLNLVISRGHEVESRRSSGQDTCNGDDARTISQYSLQSLSLAPPNPYLGFDTSQGVEEMNYEDPKYLYGTPIFSHYSP